MRQRQFNLCIRSSCDFMTAGELSDYTGAAALLDSAPKAEWLLSVEALRPV